MFFVAEAQQEPKLQAKESNMSLEHVVQHPATIRYHGLDALRAWAMSMGVVLHAAWIMTPGNSGAPKTDASASPWMDYLAGGIHMFRMQLFFVLAGFFACLLVRKRGPRRFSINRLLRVGLPLLLFWLVLRPPMTAQFYEAQIQSGGIQGDKTAWSMVQTDYQNMAAESVFTMHLWFIYYLFVTYIIVLLVRTIVVAIDRNSNFRDWLSNGFCRVLTSPWSVVPLAVLTGAFMLPMDNFYGIQIDAFSLYPVWSGLLCYAAFFMVGWLIFRNVDQLSEMLRGWKWQLAGGALLTVPYYFFSLFTAHNGYQTEKYPALTVHDMHYNQAIGEPMYPQFREKLLSAGMDTTAGVALRMLPEPNQQFLRETPTATENQISGLLDAFNIAVLAKADFADQSSSPTNGALSPRAKAIQDIPAKDRNPDDVQWLNREILQADFAGILWSEDINRPNYMAIRVAYCFSYSLATWMLIFGCIGFSRHYFDEHSRFWRYFSDASYWIFLMHLIVQFQILLWVGDQPWHWTLKFGLYVLGTLAVLVPTYHLLVRPTWLGWLLNGRMVPFGKAGNTAATDQMNAAA